MNIPSRSSRASLITFLGLLFFFLILNIRMIQPYILTTLMGGILAMLSYRGYHRLREKKWGPKTAAFTVTMAVLFVVILPLAGFAYAAIQQGIAIGQNLAENPELSPRILLERIASWGPVKTLIGDTAALERQARTTMQSGGKMLSGVVLGVLSAAPQLLLELALAMIACFFFLIDGKRFLAWIANKIPMEPEVREQLMKAIQETTVSVTWATLAAAAAQAAIMFISFLALGVPGAFLAAGATFIFAWVPMLGSVPVVAVGCVYLFAEGEIVKLVIMVILGIVTGIVDNFVRPLVLKGGSDMHPLVSLIAIFGGIELFGIFGVFYGPILTAILISLLSIWPDLGRKFGLTFDRSIKVGESQVKVPESA